VAFIPENIVIAHIRISTPIWMITYYRSPRAIRDSLEILDGGTAHAVHLFHYFRNIDLVVVDVSADIRASADDIRRPAARYQCFCRSPPAVYARASQFVRFEYGNGLFLLD
jgi:hypothetical protein